MKEETTLFNQIMKRGEEQTRREAKDLWLKLKEGEDIEEDDLGKMEDSGEEEDEDEEKAKEQKGKREALAKKKKLVVKKNEKRITAAEMFKMENEGDLPNNIKGILRKGKREDAKNKQGNSEIIEDGNSSQDLEGLEIDEAAGKGNMKIGVVKVKDQGSLVQGLNLSKLRAQSKKQTSNPKSEPKLSQKRDYIEFDSEESENETDTKYEEVDARDPNSNRKKLEKEKEKDERQSKGLENNGFTDGWGNWAGGDEAEERENDREKQKLERQRRRKLKLAMKERRDAKMKDVKISTKRVKDTEGLYLQDIPFEFENKEQVNFIMNQPIGQEWNSQQNYLRNIRKKVKTKAGAIIRPIGKSDGSYKVSHF